MLRWGTARVARWTLAVALAANVAAVPTLSLASTCGQLEIQLRAASPRERDPAKLKRYSSAVERQRNEIARARRMQGRAGCTRRTNSACKKLNATVSRMEERVSELETLRDSAMGREGSASTRARLLAKLEASGCRADRRETRDDPPSPKERDSVEVVGARPQGTTGTFRTMCVRTCDGYYFPVSNHATPKSFGAAAQQCANMCPLSETRLYVHPQDAPMNEMVDRFGRPYSATPFAFRHQARNYVPNKSCSCGQPSLKQTVAQDLRGTSIDERPRVVPVSPIDAETTRNATVDFDWSAAKALVSSAKEPATLRPVRVVGPRFFPAP